MYGGLYIPNKWPLLFKIRVNTRVKSFILTLYIETYFYRCVYYREEFSQTKEPLWCEVFTSEVFLWCLKCWLCWNRTVVYLYNRYYCARTKHLCVSKSCFLFGRMFKTPCSQFKIGSERPLLKFSSSSHSMRSLPLGFQWIGIPVMAVWGHLLNNSLPLFPLQPLRLSIPPVFHPYTQTITQSTT